MTPCTVDMAMLNDKFSFASFDTSKIKKSANV